MHGLRGLRVNPPRRPLISVNGHLVGHYPLHTSWEFLLRI